MNTLDYLEAVKVRRGITSDYALAKVLGVTQSAVSSYRTGRSRIDDDVALTIAQILEINPLEVIAQANAERARTPEIRERWMEILKGFRALLSQAKFDGVECRRMARIPALSVTTA